MNEQQSVQTQDVRRNIMVRPDGTGMTLSTAAETVIVDPATGSRLFTATNTLLATIDGPIINDPLTTPLFSCAVCGQTPFTSEGVLRCDCGRIACKSNCITTDEHGPRCTICTASPWWRRAWHWLTTSP